MRVLARNLFDLLQSRHGKLIQQVVEIPVFFFSYKKATCFTKWDLKELALRNIFFRIYYLLKYVISRLLIFETRV